MPEPEALLEHRAFVRAIAKGLLRDEHAAEDVTQETLLAAMERPPQGKNVRGWLGAVARNLARMTRRGERRRHDRELRAARPEAVTPASEALELLELQRKVVEAVRALDEPYRTAVVLHYFHDLPIRQLAARLRVPKETARTRLHRGLAMLRARLDREYGGNRSWLPLAVLLAADPKMVSVAGVALMSAKAKVAVAAVVCILLTLAAVKWGGSGGTETTPRAEASRPVAATHEAEPQLPPAPVLPDPVDFNAVDRDKDLHGIVVDKSGAPIAGAELQVVFYPHRRVQTLDPESDVGSNGPRTRSASDGMFRLPLEVGQEVSLRVSAKGYAPIELRSLQAGERARVEMAEPATLVVRVKDEAGAPIAGADVQVLAMDQIAIHRDVDTDAGGVARIGDLPAGALVYVSAVHPSYGNALSRYGLSAPMETDLVLPAGRWHTGLVTDAATGAPIAGARVGMTWTLGPETRTDGQGRYRLNGWFGEKYMQAIHAVANGYVMAATTLGASTEYDFALVRGIEVRGRLLTQDGKLVPGGLLAALGDPFSSRGATGEPMSRAYGTSGTDGVFRLFPLKPGTFHTLVVTGKGFGRYLLDFDTDAGPTDLGDVTLPAGFTVGGVVLDAAGAPKARVRVTIDGENIGNRSRAHRPGRLEYHGRQEDRCTDDLGRFRFPDVAPGAYRVAVDRRRSTPISKAVVVKDTDVLDIKLEVPEERPFVIWVVDDLGQPVEQAGVHVDHAGGTSFGSTDAKGRAELRVSGDIKTVGSPSAHGYGEVKPITDLPADATEARFVLPRWEEISGAVVDEAGAPIVDALVEVRWGSASPKKVSTDTSGRFHVSVPPGTAADLRVTGKYVPIPGSSGVTEGGGLTAEMLGVAAGSRDVVLRAIVPRNDATLRVRVLTPDGKPLQGARVFYQPPMMEGRITVETDADGRALLTGLPAAEITVSVGIDPARLGFLYPAVMKVTPAGQEVELSCREALRLKGTVVDAEGAPTFAQVFAIYEGQFFNAFADKQGGFEILVPKDAESLDLQALRKTPDGLQLQGYLKHRPADGDARIVIRPPD